VLKAAVLAARTLAFSTGPSGAHIARLFERWGIAGQVQPRTVQPPPGVPVGSLVAAGEVELGFQQLSELMHLGGITVLGTLPAAVAHITTFSAGLPAGGAQAAAVREMLAFMNSAEAAATKRRHGMEPA
jgi:molybdate transport system substrate-binding protein